MKHDAGFPIHNPYSKLHAGSQIHHPKSRWFTQTAKREDDIKRDLKYKDILTRINYREKQQLYNIFHSQ